MRGPISAEFQYRVELSQLGGAQLKYNNGVAQGPAGARLVVTPSGANGLLFDFEAASYGWDGVAPLAIEARTQIGNAGVFPGTGFADTTGVLVFTP
jgi:hypothetical protein